MAIKGIGPVLGAQLLITAGNNPDRLRASASFAALCGSAPIPFSSGRTDRNRLSRGGDRQANAALHHIVEVRMSYAPATRPYRDAHLARGWTSTAVFRALRRALAREVVRALAGHCAAPDHSDLRPARRAEQLALTAAAEHLGVWPARIGELELRSRPDDELATRYRAWPNAAYPLDTEQEHESAIGPQGTCERAVGPEAFAIGSPALLGGTFRSCAG
jgi:transposase